jgi:hypothetical protein
LEIVEDPIRHAKDSERPLDQGTVGNDDARFVNEDRSGRQQACDKRDIDGDETIAIATRRSKEPRGQYLLRKMRLML